jgi:hypothetical protein
VGCRGRVGVWAVGGVGGFVAGGFAFLVFFQVWVWGPVWDVFLLEGMEVGQGGCGRGVGCWISGCWAVG